jgi:hypothetical protein
VKVFAGHLQVISSFALAMQRLLCMIPSVSNVELVATVVAVPSLLGHRLAGFALF